MWSSIDCISLNSLTEKGLSRASLPPASSKGHQLSYVLNFWAEETMTARDVCQRGMDCKCRLKAKSGNLNLFLCILPFFHCKIQGKEGKKGQNAQKKV